MDRGAEAAMIHSNLCSTKFSRIVSTGRIRITILLEEEGEEGGAGGQAEVA